MIAHVVLFKPRSDVDKTALRSFAQSFQLACRRIPSIARVRVGRVTSLNVVTDQIVGDKTYPAVAYLEFHDLAGLEAYLQHPLHAELAKLFWQYCESTIFLDADAVDPIETDVDTIFGLKT